MSAHTPGTASPASSEGPDLIAEIGGIRITRAQSPAQLAKRIANIAGEARWFGYHEQKLSGANPKDCAVARSDAQVLADAAFVLNNLNEMLEIAAHSGRPSPASESATIAQDGERDEEPMTVDWDGVAARLSTALEQDGQLVEIHRASLSLAMAACQTLAHAELSAEPSVTTDAETVEELTHKLSCNQCGRAVGEANYSLLVYCSVECEAAWHREHAAPESSPAVDAGTTDEPLTAEKVNEVMLAMRAIDEPCKACGGWGVLAYGNTATWRGGMGGSAITSDVCDKCWGSGDANRPWPKRDVLPVRTGGEQCEVTA